MYSTILLIPSLTRPIFYVAFTLSNSLLESNQYANSISVPRGNKAEWIPNTNASLNLHESVKKTKQIECLSVRAVAVTRQKALRRLRLRVRPLLWLWHHPAVGNRAQEPLDDGLSLSQIRQRDVFIRQVRLALAKEKR
jgi:hypothetical protein